MMIIENLDKVIDENARLIRIAGDKQRIMLKMKEWVRMFEADDPPTQAQLDAKMAKADAHMAEVESAFNSAKNVYTASEVITDE